MTTVILVIHLLLAIALVGLILVQRSEGGALGMGGGGGMGGFMTGRATANLLTRATTILAVLFMTTSLVLAIMAKGSGRPASILDQPGGVPAATQPAEPAEPKGPEVPLAK